MPNVEHDGVELQPDNDEVLQAEPVYALNEPPVSVVVEGPVRTQPLPTKAGGTVTRTLTTTPGLVLKADHRRRRALLVSVGQNIYVALNQASAQDVSRMALWPQNVPLELTNDSDVYAAAATGTTQLGVVTELWATGEAGID
jgi:hypothetical protein